MSFKMSALWFGGWHLLTYWNLWLPTRCPSASFLTEEAPEYAVCFFIVIHIHLLRSMAYSFRVQSLDLWTIFDVTLSVMFLAHDRLLLFLFSLDSAPVSSLVFSCFSPFPMSLHSCLCLSLCRCCGCGRAWYQPVICPSLLTCISSDHHLLQYINPGFVPVIAGSLLVPWWLPLWLYLSAHLTSLNLFFAISRLIIGNLNGRNHMKCDFSGSETNHIWR